MCFCVCACVRAHVCAWESGKDFANGGKERLGALKVLRLRVPGFKKRGHYCNVLLPLG